MGLAFLISIWSRSQDVPDILRLLQPGSTEAGDPDEEQECKEAEAEWESSASASLFGSRSDAVRCGRSIRVEGLVDDDPDVFQVKLCYAVAGATDGIPGGTCYGLQFPSRKGT